VRCGIIVYARSSAVDIPSRPVDSGASLKVWKKCNEAHRDSGLEIKAFTEYTDTNLVGALCHSQVEILR
jgi:hypothetical protein